MKYKIILLPLFCLACMPVWAQKMLSMEDETLGKINQICVKVAFSGMGFSTSKAESIFSQICTALNINNSSINIIACRSFSGSARAVVDNDDNQKYLLYNPDRFNVMEGNSAGDWGLYLLFAHEVAHHFNKHLEKLPQYSNNRQAYLAKCREYELDADRFAGYIIKKLNGNIDKAIQIFDDMIHPSEASEYLSDHPIKSKRIEAVRQGFGTIVRVENNENVKVTDLLPSAKNWYLLKLDNPDNLKGVVRKYAGMNFYPVGLTYSSGSYFMICQKRSINLGYHIYWNYDTFPVKELQADMNNGMYVEQIDVANGKWFAVLLKDSTWAPKTAVFYASKFEFENKQGTIHDYMTKGYYFKNVIPYGNGYYILAERSIISDKISATDYAIFNSTNEYNNWAGANKASRPHPVIRKRFGEKRFFFIVYPRTNEKWHYTLMNMKSSSSDFNELQQRFNEGYFLNTMYSSGDLLEFNLWKW